MRTKMPRCAAFVDALREAFGVDEINSVIKRGLRSDAKPSHQVYFAEASNELGHRPRNPSAGVMPVLPVPLPPKRGRR